MHANALHRNLIALDQRNFALATVIPKQLALFQAAILPKKLAKLAHTVILTLRRNSSFLPECQSRLDCERCVVHDCVLHFLAMIHEIFEHSCLLGALIPICRSQAARSAKLTENFWFQHAPWYQPEIISNKKCGY